MTLARAEVAKKRCGEVVSIVDNTPPTANFLQNSNTSNHVQRNRMDAPTAAAAPTSASALPAAPVSMIKRVMKQAGYMFFSRAVSS